MKKSLSATNRSSKPKFQLKQDGTLGWVDPEKFFSDVDFGNDNLPKRRQWEPYCSAYPDLLEGSHDSITHVDWFRATVTGSDTLFLVDELQALIACDDSGVVADTDIIFNHSNKGLHGYPEQIKISLQTDGGLVNLGGIGVAPDPLSPNCGVMLDLSGQFFTYINQYQPYKIRRLFDFVTAYGFRASRIDIALDMNGQYCRFHNITVPSLGKRHASDGLFKSEFNRGGGNQSMAQLGDWSCMIYGHATVDTYNPEEHASKGLTQNIGSRKSPNFFRVYEKSKQIIATAELGDDHDLDKWAVRIEQEIKRDKHGSDIPMEILLNPDAFFATGRPLLRDLLLAYAEALGLKGLLAAHKERFKKNVQLSLAKKVYWAKQSYGRVIRSLISEGKEAQEIVDMLVREKGLKDFVFDIADVDLSPVDRFDFVSHGAYDVSSELADKIRAYYANL